MKTVWSSSKFITYTYYGHPVDHCTMELQIAEGMDERTKALLIEQARRRLDNMPVEQFPVAGAHVTLLPEYFKRHPELAKETTNQAKAF